MLFLICLTKGQFYQADFRLSLVWHFMVRQIGDFWVISGLFLSHFCISNTLHLSH
jgi:hypothetical protein